MAAAAILDLFEPEIAPLDPPSPKTLYTLEQNMKWIGRPVAEIWPFEVFPRWRRPPSSAVILDLFEPEMAPLDPPFPKTLP